MNLPFKLPVRDEPSRISSLIVDAESELVADLQSVTPEEHLAIIALINLGGATLPLIAALEELGFDGTDSPVNGGDCVDVVAQHIDALRALADELKEI